MRTPEDTLCSVRAKNVIFGGPLVRLYTHAVTLRRLHVQGETERLGDYIGLIKGQGGHEALVSADALFQGTNRPHNRPGFDENVLIYISSPLHRYDLRNTGPPVDLRRMPSISGLVLATYAILAEHTEDGQIEFDSEYEDHLRIGLVGEVRGWEWVDADPADLRLPLGHRTKYRRKLW